LINAKIVVSSTNGWDVPAMSVNDRSVWFVGSVERLRSPVTASRSAAAPSTADESTS
jgi:hypothetical protein